VDDCVAIGLALTRALAHLHEHGLVHRDIKPSNIIFVDGSPKLADIGLVTGIDATRSFVGTDGYIPPEGPRTPQADLYSLGKVLYEMSTGRDRLDFPELPDEWRTSPERERLLEFNEVVLKACEDDIRQRYASAQQLESDLALLQCGQSVKRLRVADRRWAVFKKATVAVTALILLSAAFVMLWHGLNRDQYSGDGPPSTNALANALCAKALLVLRGDNRAAFAEAYTNLHRAIGLDSHFARPYVGLFELRSREITPELPPTSSEEIHSIAHRLEALAPSSLSDLRTRIKCDSLKFDLARFDFWRE
jgi:serine/threonine protein kinase